MKLRLLLGLLLLLPRLGAAQGRVVELRDTTRAYVLAESWEILAATPPPGTSFTPEQVMAAPLAGQFEFRPAPAARPDGPSPETWLRLRVRSTAGPATAWVLEAGRSYNAFEVFVVGPANRIRHLEAGQAPHWAATYAVPGRRYNINLPLAVGQPYTLYIHCGGGLLDFSIFERTHLLARNRQGDAWACLYFGLLLGLVVYNLLLFFSVRDRSYLYYVLFTASFGLLQAVMMGYVYMFWGPYLPATYYNLLQHSLLAIVMASSIMTGRSFLETRLLLPRLDRLLLLALAATPLLPLGSLLQWYQLVNVVDWALPLTVCILLLIVGTAALLRGSRPARYYMAGWALLILAIVWYYLRVIGLVPTGFLTENGVRMASALEVLLLSLGLGDRINLIRRERHQAQAEALAALQEKETVQTAANQALAQRATELQYAYAELQASHQTTDRLQENDQLKTRFFTNISHELRTPLTLILGPLEQLMTRAEAAPLADEHQLMRRHGQRLLTLLNQLLDIARLEAGQLRLQAQPTDLGAFVRIRVAAFDSLATAQHIQLLVKVPPPPLTAYIDHDQLEKVLTNLLGNALKFTPAGGAVAVEMREENGRALISVADNGCGIPATHLPLIFDRFHQVDDSTSRRHEGSGIGLALVKELMALHHGSVSVESTEGMGTTFTLQLPLGTTHLAENELLPPAFYSEDSSAAVPLPLPAPVGTDAAQNQVPEEADARPLVLVVDDHADMRAYVASCLADNYRIALATDGHDGLHQIAELGPDLVISDVMMPGLDGLELCRRVKTDERSSHIPVVLLTARASDQGKLDGLTLGADDYLTKPFRPAELQARVHNLIRQRQQLRARFGREVTLQPRDISITSADEAFLQRVMAVVEQHLAEPEFDVESFAAELNITRVHLYRKLKALTDQTPTEFVRTLRLRRAAQLLAAQAGNVADVAYQVGFINLSYFSKCFRELYGHVPSEHIAK